ncbi:hypothetical protein QKT49_gp452 [Acanthamoeba castellanii medusavirus]|uniref:Uncharacterized protein n=1 Tax=Acanthamoeba castellanii medusavirus J1 TaxID=3114988 RepID=A0A3T1CWW1_9VIRU|nr:hypothetical protein QKT49_gp452 [Acanthamoeba castellanii medusavirus]BBI30311.1 hypothetical protein [Acanthamoeba castellanii medusavirus J1]
MQDANEFVHHMRLNYGHARLDVAADKHITPVSLEQHANTIVNAPFNDRKLLIQAFIHDALGVATSEDLEQTLMRASIIPPSRCPFVVWMVHESGEIHVAPKEWLDCGLEIRSSLFMTFALRV